MNKTVERTIEILNYFSSPKDVGGIGISRIARELGVSKSSISDILYSLLDLGYLQYDNEQMKTFRLGNGAIRFGLSTLRQYDFPEIARPELSVLHRECGFTVYAGVEVGEYMTFVDKIEGKSAIKFSDGIGSMKPLHLTAIGKALLAGHSDDEILDILGDTCYEVRTKNSLNNPRSVLADIAKVRRRGYALENFEENDYTYGIAAPVFDMHGNVCAGIGINVFSTDITEEQIPGLIKAVCDTARRISHHLGSTTYNYKHYETEEK